MIGAPGLAAVLLTRTTARLIRVLPGRLRFSGTLTRAESALRVSPALDVNTNGVHLIEEV